MSSITQRHARYVKSLGIAAIVISTIFLPIEFYFMYLVWGTSRASNCFFHFNFQYRAGDEEVENNIIQEPYYRILQLFEKHPTWNFTIEIQGSLIERLLRKPEFEFILNLTRKLNHRGQMEIICGLYSSQLIHPYPQTAIEWSFKHTYHLLKEANLSRSRVLLCQEGQVDLGLVNVLNSNWSAGIDTLIVPWQVIHTFAPPGYKISDSPLYSVDQLVPGKMMNLIIYDYFPRLEAGYMHYWPYCKDAEIGFDREGAEPEFTIDEAKLNSFEQQWMMLEREGNHFFTIDQWVSHCEEVGAIQSLNFYIPETHWGPLRYNSSHIWMGMNSDTDDGEMIANNRRGYFTVCATQILYEHYKSRLNIDNRSQIEAFLEDSEKHVVLAMCTDTSGINPRWYERVFGETQVYYAINKCSEVVSIIISEIPELIPNSTFQVDLLTQSIENNSLNFHFPSFNNLLSPSDLPITFDVCISPNFTTLAPIVTIINNTFEGVNYQSLKVTFPGTWDWAIDAPNELQLILNVNSSHVVYSPSLTDSINFTKNMTRSDYASGLVNILLPLSNGLIFIPDSPHSITGMAIINNCTSRHTSIWWADDSLRFIELGGVHLNATYHLIFVEHIDLADAVSFAQRVNTYPYWIISDNLTFMAGHESYELYSQVAHAT
ncbi:MAG: hypothetical protein ACTSQI_12210 [Candidatus Helarchaeota archaeon]